MNRRLHRTFAAQMFFNLPADTQRPLQQNWTTGVDLVQGLQLFLGQRTIKDHARQGVGFYESILSGIAILLIVIPTVPADGRELHDEADAYRAQGYEAQQRGDRQNAMVFYQKAIALNPAYAAPHNDLGTLLEDQGRLEEAEHAYQQALMIQPHYPEAHANLALLYERMGQQQEKALYHWLKRYELGSPDEAGTQRAKERLLAAGIFHALPDVKPEPDASAAMAPSASGTTTPSAPNKSDLFNETLESHAKSLEEFHDVTNTQREWSR